MARLRNTDLEEQKLYIFGGICIELRFLKTLYFKLKGTRYHFIGTKTNNEHILNFNIMKNIYRGVKFKLC